MSASPPRDGPEADLPAGADHAAGGGGSRTRRRDAGAAADPYMTALCYFNALRELGGARRIVEDEVRTRLGDYGTERTPRSVRRISPFADRRLREVPWN